MTLGESRKKTYKVKLSSGRILGPLKLDQVLALIKKNQITGVETARIYPKEEWPEEDWKDINQIPEIADLLIQKAQGDLTRVARPVSSEPLSPAGGVGSTVILPGAPADPPSFVLAPLPELPTAFQNQPKDPKESLGEADDRTMVADLEDLEKASPNSHASPSQSLDDERTQVALPEEIPDLLALPPEEESQSVELGYEIPNQNISNERTIVFQRKSDSPLPGKKKKGSRDLFRVIGIGLLLGYFGYDFLLSEPERPALVRQEPIRPRLPSYIKGGADPAKSTQIYEEGIKFYLQDTVVGYRQATNKFLLAASYDINNVKALALLASSYLNLIDSSNKDENYFQVLSRLIEMSRAKSVDLTETVIADVEFFLMANKAEAAGNRIIEYTKQHPKYGLEMFYYLSLAFYARGDMASAARYLAQFPDNKAFSPKIFFLRGQIAEKLRDNEAAINEYKKALRLNPQHAKSQLRLAAILSAQGNLKAAAHYLDFITINSHLLSPKDLGLAYYLHAQLSELFQKWDIALGDVERAVKLDPENHDYLLEMFTLRAKAGDSLQSVQKQARMYYFLGEGEKLIQQGKYQEALIPLLQARSVNETSPIPLVKIGDMFSYLKDPENARRNYKLATERAANDIKVWSKYINSLIECYEWEEAVKAMEKFRKLPVQQSSIDKAAADLYQKQNSPVIAQTFYRKAMARDSIDPDVYIAYAKSLMSTKNFKDAPFFFALALRFDPLNVDAIIGTAKCVAETESIEKAISLLQDELQRGIEARAEFLTAIAELQIQRGDWEQAQKTIQQAMQANPDYAQPWKLQAQYYMNREGQDHTALKQALESYQSYSERNPSDPSGYLERYRIYMKQTEFEKAKEELNKIYGIHPKYPKLHYYLGALYAVQGNHKIATEEFRRELLNNPNDPVALIAYGRELIETQRPQEALTQFTKAMQVAPDSADAKQNAGWASYQLKNYQAAVTLIRAALAIDKANPTLHKRLGIVYRDMGDLMNACAAFRKYLEMEPDAPDKGDFRACL